MGIVAGTSAGNSINRGLLALFLFHSFGLASVYFSSPSSQSSSSGNNDKEEEDEDVLFELCKLHVAVDDGLGHQARSFQRRIPILFHILRARIPTLGAPFQQKHPNRSFASTHTTRRFRRSHGSGRCLHSAKPHVLNAVFDPGGESGGFSVRKLSAAFKQLEFVGFWSLVLNSGLLREAERDELCRQAAKEAGPYEMLSF